MKKRALGRGLSALLPDSSGEAGGAAGLIHISLEELRENPLQPRQRFDEERLRELAESIRVHGVVQPVVVTRAAEGYRLVVGERRTRAARLAGLESIPALVREAADQEMLELALVENLQREDLNPLEEARAFSHLLRERGLTHEQLAERLGCSRPAVSNALRLLVLPDEIRDDLEAGVLTAGHARAVLPLDGGEQLAVWREVRERGLSVRQTEELVARRSSQEGAETPSEPRPPARLTPDWLEIQDQLQHYLGTPVRIQPRARGRGRVELHYSNSEELERLVEMLIYLGERVNARPASLSMS